MKLHGKIKNVPGAYALKVFLALAGFVGLESVLRIGSADEILIQVLIFTVLVAVGVYRQT